MNIERESLSELPPAYGAAFDAFTAEWSPARQALGRAMPCWLLDTPPMNGFKSRRPGDELERRLISTDEWDAMRRTLASIITRYPNDELILTTCAIKDFHPSAFQHLPAEMLEHLASAHAAVGRV